MNVAISAYFTISSSSLSYNGAIFLLNNVTIFIFLVYVLPMNTQ